MIHSSPLPFINPVQHVHYNSPIAATNRPDTNPLPPNFIAALAETTGGLELGAGPVFVGAAVSVPPPVMVSSGPPGSTHVQVGAAEQGNGPEVEVQVVV